MIPKILLQKARELEDRAREKLPGLAPLAKQCFLNTIETTVTQLEDGSYFVITGDIPAMWLRDSAAQLKPYVPYAKEDEDLQAILRSVIQKYTFYVRLDPYTNAFNSRPQNGYTEDDRSNFQSGWIWERKYEVDSLCAPLYLAHQYYQVTGDKSIFTEEFRLMIQTIANTFTTEQRHDCSPYWFVREHAWAPSDTLPMNGRGRPVNFTGMTWSGFRPSDDSCKFGYLIPSNMMAAVALDYAGELLQAGFEDPALEARCESLAAEIRDGIETNSPSLLSIPYIGYKPAEDPIYQNTRRFVLSQDNPYYFVGKAAKGIGSPHTPPRYIWHIGLVMQILTSLDPAEKRECLDMLARTHAGPNYMHEGFDADDPARFTRPWFAWANTLFAQMLEREVDSL